VASRRDYDVVIVGGGIVGVATAMALLEKDTDVSLVIVEAEDHLAAHQTGHNSGVIHSGLYYKPGSLKASNCVAGRQALERFCEAHDIPFERCGKVVVATREDQLPRLAELEARGLANGLAGLRRLSREEIAEFEPHARGVAALHVPQTGIVDYSRVTEAFAAEVRERGGEIVLGATVRRARPQGSGLLIETTKGPIVANNLINCAGLESDRVAFSCGVKPGLRIVPFRGEYYEVAVQRRHLVRNLIYPVPDPEFPFLGVHFTRKIAGGVEAGPNAVLAFKREGYSRTSFSLGDAMGIVADPGFWRLAARYWKTGMGEMWRSWNKRAFVRALRELVPELREADLNPGGSGVRAQALEANGALLDDFRIIEEEHMIHVLNAPSPAATASIAIGRHVAALAARNFGLATRPG
jgi:(S)-2-hydroxyglutarate dehydrogenase